MGPVSGEFTPYRLPIALIVSVKVLESIVSNPEIFSRIKLVI